MLNRTGLIQTAGWMGRALLFLTLFLGGCHSFRTPVGPFEPPAPRTSMELADRLGENLRPYQTLTAEMQTSGRTRFQFRPARNTILMRYRPPDAVLLGLGHVPFEPLGILLRVVQHGEHLAVSDRSAFYVGTIGDLDDYPGLFFGLEPRNLANPLTAVYEAAEALRESGSADALPKPSFWRKTWQVEKKNEKGGRIVYTLRLQDGLVEKIAIYDGRGKRQARIFYRAYQDFSGALFPSDFEVAFRSHGLRLRVAVQRITLHQTSSDDKFFALDPPPGMPRLPLSEFLARIR